MLSLKLAWRNIWRNKRRTLITMCSIVVAVFLSVITRSTQEGQYNNMIENTVGTFTGYIQIHKAGYKENPSLNNSFSPTDSLYQTIQSEPAVTAVLPRIEGYVLAASTGKTRPALVMGIDIRAEQKLSEPKEHLVKGSYFSSNNERAVIIGHKLMERLNAQVGDSLVLIGQGFHGRKATGLYPIKGTVSYPNPEMNSSLIFLPLNTAQRFFHARNHLTTISLVLNNPESLNEAVQGLKKKLPPQQYEILGWKDLLPGLHQAIQADRSSGMIILFVLYIVVGFGILGTVLMMIAERSYEFGVMLSVGTPRWTIAQLISYEILFISLIGACIGILLSIPVVWYFHLNPIELSDTVAAVYKQYNIKPIIQFAVETTIFISQAVVVLILTLIFSTIPIFKAARLNPIKAMRA